MTGIYKIENKINNQFYIGSSCTIQYRFNRHKSNLRLNRHENPHLQNSWNKNGESNFTFDVICYCNKEELLFHEQQLINKLKPHYNINLKAFKPPSPKGRIRSEETNRRLSNSLKGRTRTEQEKQAMRKPKTIKVVNQHKYKQVEQVDRITGQIINIHKSVVQAAKELDPNNFIKRKSGISKCLQGKNQSAYGYFWREKEKVSI